MSANPLLPQFWVGSYADLSRDVCPRCGGTGKEPFVDGANYFVPAPVCDECEGDGRARPDSWVV